MNTTTTEDTSHNRPRRLVPILRVAVFSVAALATAVSLFYAEENWRGERAWAAHLKAMAALGESLDLEALAPAPVPDDQNFAKTPVLEALAYQPKSSVVEPIAKLRDMGLASGPMFPWSRGLSLDLQQWLASLPAKVRAESVVPGLAPAAQVRAVLKPLEPVMTELRAASHTRPQSLFRSILTPNNRFDFPNFDGLYGLSQLVGVYVSAELAEGRTDQAFEDALVLHRLAAAIEADGTLLNVMVFEAICNGSEMQVFWDGWRDSRWTSAQYEAFQKRFGASNGPIAYNRALRRERAISNRVINADKPEIPWANLGAHHRWPSAFIPHAWWRQNLIVSNLAMQQALANGFDETPPRYRPAEVARLEAQFKELQESHSPFDRLAVIVMSNINTMAPRFANETNRISMAGVVCALERCKAEQGEYPEKLETLLPKFAPTLPTDIYTGQPFHYRRTADGQFMLYSFGPNEKDDGGVKGDDWAWPARSVPQVGPAHDDESRQNGLNTRERYQSEIDRRRRLRAGAVQDQAQ